MSYTSLDHLYVIACQGEDTATFLQGQLTADILALQIKQGCMAAYCDRKGRVQTDLHVYRQSNDLYLLILSTALGEFIQSELQKYVLRSKVNFSQPKLFCYGTTEANDNEMQMPLCDGANRYIQLSEQSLNCTGTEAEWLLQNIKDGYASITPETRAVFTPQMLNYEKIGAISFDKGCYIGQEIVARTEHLGKLKRHLQYFAIPIALTPRPGDAINNADGKAIGTVVNSALEGDECHILAVMQDDALQEVKET